MAQGTFPLPANRTALFIVLLLVYNGWRGPDPAAFALKNVTSACNLGLSGLEEG